jgi:hypothetical protein
LNKILVSFTLGLILTFTIFTNNSYAESGNQIWLKKTKRGINISCPSGFQYSEEIRYSCIKQNDSGFDILLSYNDLYGEKEFFDEKEIMKQAIILVKLSSNVKIIEKKTSTWFGKITADIKYESDKLKGLQRMIVFNDGTVVTMNYLSEKKSYDIADKVLSENIKILEPNQVKELEKIQEEYTKQAQELANKREAEKYKQKLEQEKKEIESKKKAAKEAIEAKKKAAKEAVSPIGKNNVTNTITKLLDKIQTWKSKVVQLDKRYEKVSSYDEFNVQVGFEYLKKSISEFENKINLVNENTTNNQIKDMIKNAEAKITGNYNFVDNQIKEMEHRAQNKNKCTTWLNC